MTKDKGTGLAVQHFRLRVCVQQHMRTAASYVNVMEVCCFLVWLVLTSVGIVSVQFNYTGFEY